MRRIIFTSVAFVFATVFQLFGQKTVKDTLTFVHYNLLNYGVSNPQACSNFNFDMNYQDNQLKTILQYLKPDVLTVNEMGCNEVYLRRIRQNCLNIGTSKYEYAPLQHTGGQNLCNGLLYNSEKLGLLHSKYIDKGKTGSSFIRVIDFHKLYVKGGYLKPKSDTISFTQLVAHLKAGSSDAAARGYTAEGVMYYLEQNEDTGNYLISGDMNMYRASETAYQQFTNYSNARYKFVDPLNAKWDKFTHTQSTRTGSCGGMDDRFDMTLISQGLKNGGLPIKYINGSYRAVGQDGKRYNGSVISPSNEDVPAYIAQALYNLSDHLPVVVQLEVQYEVSTSIEANENKFEIVPLSSSHNEVGFLSKSSVSRTLEVSLYSIEGSLLYHGNYQLEGGQEQWTIPGNYSGIYLLVIQDSGADIFETYKVIVP